MYSQDLASNNLQWLICHKTQVTKPNQSRRKAYLRREAVTKIKTGGVRSTIKVLQTIIYDLMGKV